MHTPYQPSFHDFPSAITLQWKVVPCLRSFKSKPSGTLEGSKRILEENLPPENSVFFPLEQEPFQKKDPSKHHFSGDMLVFGWLRDVADIRFRSGFPTKVIILGPRGDVRVLVGGGEPKVYCFGRNFLQNCENPTGDSSREIWFSLYLYLLNKLKIGVFFTTCVSCSSLGYWF